MKTNLPITGKEIPVDAGTVIVSKTDLKGIITSVNSDFIRISGFSEAELVSSNHNILRHPDMPPAAFEDLWNTIRAGNPWTGIVKNRTKCGDHYWVDASVTPVFRNGQITEYMSVRKGATQEQIRVAEKEYAALNQGKVPKRSLLQRINTFSWMKIAHKIMAAGFAVLLLVLLLLGLQIRELGKQADRARLEVAGLEYIQPLRALLQNLPEHRGMTNGYLNGDARFKPQILEKQAQIAADIQAIRRVEARHGERLGTGEQLKAIFEDWQDIQQKLFLFKPQDAFTHHTALISNVISLFAHVGDASGLVTDTALDNHYLVDMLINRIPPVSEYLGRSRGLGAGIAAKRRFGPGQHDKLAQLYGSASILFAAMDSGLEKVYRYNPRLKRQLQPRVADHLKQRERFSRAVHSNLLNADPIQVDPREYFAKGTRLIDSTFAIFDEVNAYLREELTMAADAAQYNIYKLIIWSLLAVLIITLFGWNIVRSLNSGFASTQRIFSRMSEGHYFDQIDLQRRDELGDLMRGLKSMQIKLGNDVNEARAHADAATRIKTALDNVSSSVMMADNDYNIIYMNKTVERLFRDAEADIRQDLPGFSADKLLGANIDSFHQDPLHQRQLLERLSDTYKSELKIGGRTLMIIANPVVNTAGERLGSTMEWYDRTDEVAVEKEVEQIVSAAHAGDLGRRIRLEDKHGFYQRLSGGINQLLDTLDTVFNDIAVVMGRLARGDLSHPIDRKYQGIFGMVKENINESLGNLKALVEKLRQSADLIKTSSDEIATGNSNLSARTEQQASALEETASSMQELTSTVRNNADNTQQANQLSADTRQVAERGGEVVNQAVRAMVAINSSSSQIQEIIGVINEIAFQTNLLALNASVEAARAGEQGRGFAVVATEVRNLAGRSATAAKEIKELIDDSVEKVKAGSELVNESGETLDQIVDGVKRVGSIISEIAASSHEQSAGIDQVNLAVTSMDGMTQQNAALAEEASAASGAMREKAAEMQMLMQYFKLESKQGAKGESGTMDFFKARTAHMTWRIRIRDFLDGGLSLSEDEAISHRDCVLGKWLYSTGLEQYGHFPEMQELEPEHERMHGIIKEIVQLKNNNSHAEAERRFSEIETLSDRIVDLIKDVERQVD